MRNSLFIVVALIAAAGCGSADEHPLGGPYGGSSNGAPSPTKGSTSGPDNNSPGDDGTGTPGTTGTPGNTGKPGTTPPNGSSDPPDAGTTTTPPPAADSGTTPPVTATDSGTTPPPPPPPPPPPAAPTWTAIVNAYLKSGTVGNCGAGGCHSQMNSPSSAYTWLGGKGYKGAAIADPQRSPMSWYGGNMPPQGPTSNAKATADMDAWAAAGALNN